MPKALDDRIVQQVGHYHRLFAARQIMTKSRHMIDIYLTISSRCQTLPGLLLQSTSCRQPTNLTFKQTPDSELLTSQRSSKSKFYYNRSSSRTALTWTKPRTESNHFANLSRKGCWVVGFLCAQCFVAGIFCCCCRDIVDELEEGETDLEVSLKEAYR